MDIREAHIPVGITRKGTKLKGFAGVTIHNTSNLDEGANADAHARFARNNATIRVAGFHYVVDDNVVVCTIPEDEIAEHCGRRAGNDTTVSIEICDNIDGDILAATEKAARLTADILKRHGIGKAVWKTNLYQHFDWSGKNCPADIRAGKPYFWDVFVTAVNEFMEHDFELNRLLKVVALIFYSRGEDVRSVQKALNIRGFDPGAIDGIYGPKTRLAVFDFQTAESLTVDGIVGKQTCTALGGKWTGK